MPVLAYQHGGGYGWRSSSIDFYIEGDYVDRFAAYGEGSALHFVRSTPPGGHRPEAFPVGSANLDRLRESVDSGDTKHSVYVKHGLQPGKKVVLYVVDQFMGNWGYYPNYYPDTWYYAHQKRVVEVLAGHPEFQFLVKLASGHAKNPLGDFVHHLGASHIKVVTAGRFTQLLPVADAILIDYPAATLAEALVTEKPVLVLTDDRLGNFTMKEGAYPW